jgi:hypothetical protein
MKTVPDIALEEHINGWLKTQQEYFPQLTKDMLVFYNEEDVVRTEIGESVEKKKLMKMKEFELFFEKLCYEGREWINLSGDSWYGKSYIVSVEYSKRLGLPKTAIARSGPTFDGKGKPLAQTRLKIIE